MLPRALGARPGECAIRRAFSLGISASCQRFVRKGHGCAPAKVAQNTPGGCKVKGEQRRKLECDSDDCVNVHSRAVCQASIMNYVTRWMRAAGLMGALALWSLTAVAADLLKPREVNAIPASPPDRTFAYGLSLIHI